MKTTNYTWGQFDEDCEKIANWAKKFQFENVYGIPRSGAIVAVKISYLLQIPMITDVDEIDADNTLVVDDSTNTGDTLSALRDKVGDFICSTLLWYESAPEPDFYCMKKTSWIVFPWKRDLQNNVTSFPMRTVATPAALGGAVRIDKKGLA